MFLLFGYMDPEGVAKRSFKGLRVPKISLRLREGPPVSGSILGFGGSDSDSHKHSGSFLPLAVAAARASKHDLHCLRL